MKNIFINGCSFLDIHHKYSTSAGKELSEKLNLNLISYAEGGKGNDRIIITTKLFFYDNLKLIQNTFVLIGWSSAIRCDYLIDKSKLGHSTDNNKAIKKNRRRKHRDWRTWNLLTGIKKAPPVGISINKNLRLRYLEQVLSLQDFFQNNDIKYCMYNALSNDWCNETKGLGTLANKVDKNRFFEFDGPSHFDFCNKDTDEIGEQLIIGKFINKGPTWIPGDEEPGLSQSKTGERLWADEHPNVLGHKLWAEKLERFVKENGLL